MWLPIGHLMTHSSCFQMKANIHVEILRDEMLPIEAYGSRIYFQLAQLRSKAKNISFELTLNEAFSLTSWYIGKVQM